MKLTEQAAGEVKKVMAGQGLDPVSTYLRVGVTGGGCSGVGYTLGFVPKQETDALQDVYYTHFGVTSVIERRSEGSLVDTTVDFHESDDRRGFLFQGSAAPAAGGGCCGGGCS